MLTACSASPTLDLPELSAQPPAIELTRVPYYPEDRYYCGPQSLAMVLGASGRSTTPSELVNAVYVPERRGAFTAEMRAAARSRGRLPYRLAPRLEALVAALADGYPVLILQNRGLDIAPSWHYAALIGYDRRSDRVVLRSGPHRRHVTTVGRFADRWRRGGHWAVVLLGPTDFPDWLERNAYEDQLGYLESHWEPHLETIYRRMLARWPESMAANLGLGNHALEDGNLQTAAAYYRRVLSEAPGNIAALNNLAETEARRGNADRALELACSAYQLAQGHPLLPAVTATLESIAADWRAHCGAARK